MHENEKTVFENSDIRNVFHGSLWKGYFYFLGILLLQFIIGGFWGWFIAYPSLSTKIHFSAKLLWWIPVVVIIITTLFTFYIYKCINVVEIAPGQGILIKSIKRSSFFSWNEIEKALLLRDFPPGFMLCLVNKRFGLGFTGLSPDYNREVVNQINYYLSKLKSGNTN